MGLKMRVCNMSKRKHINDFSDVKQKAMAHNEQKP